MTPRQAAQSALLEHILAWAGVPPHKAQEAAQALLEHFHDPFTALNAPLEELCRLSGLEPMDAAYLRFFPRAAARYLHLSVPSSEPVTTRAALHKLLWNYFCYQREAEGVYALCVDLDMHPLACGVLGEGSRTQVELVGEKIVAMAMGKPVAGIFLAHNHPNASTGFSEEDFQTTSHMSHQLGSMGIALLDHFLVTEHHLFSMRDALQDDYRLMWDVFATQPWFLPETDLWQMPLDQPEFF